MHFKLDTIKKSNLILARRLGKLSLLYDIGCLPFFRTGWVKRGPPSMSPFEAVEDSLRAWEEAMGKAGKEDILEAVDEESDSEHDEFFDFDE
jgi:hypothetical protein